MSIPKDRPEEGLLEPEAPALEFPPMSEEEFEAWCDEDTRAEFVAGKVIILSPVSLLHDRIMWFLGRLIGTYLELRGGGRLRGPEIQVRLRQGLRRVPDLLFVATEHEDRLRPARIEGPPDAAWEIVSSESEERDRFDKHAEYEATGVREYWIVEPELHEVRLYRLDETGQYQLVAEQDGRLVSQVIPGFWLRPEWLWQEPEPKTLDCLREMGVLL
jgi:Uma2 family endonuclease